MSVKDDVRSHQPIASPLEHKKETSQHVILPLGIVLFRDALTPRQQGEVLADVFAKVPVAQSPVAG